jgi:hypothetical protein
MIDGSNLYVFVHNNPVRWVDPTGFVTWRCVFATGSYGGGIVLAKCESDCVRGQRVKASYLGAGLGFGIHIGPAELEDDFEYADAANLEGWFGLATLGGEFMGGKADLVVAVFMGKASNVEFFDVGMGGQADQVPMPRVRFGAMAVMGATAKVAEWWNPCCE